MKTIATISTLLITFACAQSQNLLVNGNFDAGNVGFSSTYQYSPNDTIPEAVYAVLPDPSQTHHLAASYKDHTTGTGLMLVANGSSDAADVVWKQTVSVATNRSYAFSGWGSTWGHNADDDLDPAPSSMVIYINGVQRGGAVQLQAKNGQWQSFTALWDSQSNTQAVIEIRLATTAFVGNDIALDDFSFTSLNTNQFAEVTLYRSVEVEWNSISNRLYQVQWASSVPSETWFDLGSPVLAKGTNTWISDRILTWDKKFYRVLSLQ